MDTYIFSVSKFVFVWLDWYYGFSGISTQSQNAIRIIYQGTISMTPLYVAFDPLAEVVFSSFCTLT